MSDTPPPPPPGSPPPPPPSGGAAPPPPGGQSAMTADERQMAMLLHLSALSGLITGVGFWLGPLLVWLIKREQMPAIDAHGKAAINWIISSFILTIIGAILTCVFVGIFVLIAVAILSIVFPIIAGLKANEGVLWKYPLSYEFLK